MAEAERSDPGAAGPPPEVAAPLPAEALGQTLPGDALSAEGLREHYRRTVATEHAAVAGAEGTQPRLLGATLDQRLREAGLAPLAGACIATVDASRYQLAGMLGAGATGRVYAARDANLGREVAVKVLARPAGADPEGVAAFIAEARVTAALVHPNILPVHEIDLTAQGQPYFTMAKVAGRTLADAVDASTPAERDAKIASFNAVVNIFIAIGNALSFAHHRGVVHQDVKPDNILLGDYGEILLLDWGSATAWPGSTSSGLYGTPIFMSPEQARREGSTPRSDIYCVGASLFHALLLRYPTWCDDPEAFWERKRRGEIDAPTLEERRRVPPALIGVALKAMAVDPAARYASAEDLVADLERWQSGQAVTAHREPLVARLARWYRRNARLAQVSAAALIAVCAIGGALWSEKLEERGSWTLAWADDFASGRAERLGEDWELVQKPHFGPGAWTPAPVTAGPDLELAGGALVLKTQHQMEDLVFRRSIVGDLRVEWDYASNGGTNLNCFLGPNREDGFTFHISSWGDSTYMVMTHGADMRIVDMRIAAQPFAVDRVYHFTLERHDQRASLAIDGERVFDYMDVEHELPQRFGFDCYAYMRLRISHLRVYEQPLPRKVSPLAVAGKLYQVGDYVDAERQYQQIESAYPDTDLAREAFFWIGMCAVRRDEAARGLGLLADFESMNPGHPLVPFSLHERLVQAVRTGDGSREARVREALACYPGHPIVGTVLRELGESRIELLKPRPATTPADDPYPDGIEERIIGTLAELKRWAGRYRMPWQGNPFTHDAAERLIELGRADVVLAEYAPTSREYGEALYHTAQYDRLLAGSVGRFALRGAAIRERLSPDEAAGAKDVDEAWRLFVTGRHEELLKLGPSSWADDVLIDTGRAEEVLAKLPAGERESSFDGSYRMRALLALGRPEQVLAESTSRGMRAQALLDLGRVEEALAEAPADEGVGARGALVWLTGGDPRGRELLLALARRHTDFTDLALVFSHHLLPPLLDAIDGRRETARARLAELSARYPLQYRQTMRFVIERALGRIGDRAFMLQPYRGGLESRLALARAIGAELEGDRAAAAAAYRDYLAVPFWRADRRDPEKKFAAWRLRALEQPSP